MVCRYWLASLVVLVATVAAAGADGLRVVASIKPLHALVASVMGDLGAPTLLVRGGASPHSYALRPSDARALEGADVVFWISADLEVFLADTLETLGRDARCVELVRGEGLLLLPVRDGAAWDAHPHGAEHDDTDHGADDHDGAHEAVHADHDEADDGHAQRVINPHIWLDPENAAAMVDAIVATLAAADPGNAETYRTNGAATAERLAALTDEMAATLAPVAGSPFIVFHDAFPYLEQRFDLNALGAITVSPEVQPGAGRLREIRERIEALGAVCVFAEPQFAPALVDMLVEDTAVRTGVLDPLGIDIPEGPDQYFTLMRRNAAALRDCLGGQD